MKTMKNKVVKKGLKMLGRKVTKAGKTASKMGKKMMMMRGKK